LLFKIRLEESVAYTNSLFAVRWLNAVARTQAKMVIINKLASNAALPPY